MIVPALFLLLTVLLFLPIRLRFLADGTAAVRLSLFFWKIPILHLRLIFRLRAGRLPSIYLEKKKVCTRIFPKKRRRKRRRPPLADAALKAYRIETLHMNIVIGTEDAAATAYTVGLLYDAVGFLLMRLPMKSTRRAEIRILPHFEGAHFSAEGECIISATLANIIRKAIFRKEHICTRLKTFLKAQ